MQGERARTCKIECSSAAVVASPPPKEKIYIAATQPDGQNRRNFIYLFIF